MATNRVSVEWTEAGGLEVKVYDGAGVETDITSIFQKMSGATGVGVVRSVIELGNGTTDIKIDFRPSAKELNFDTTPGVISQILEAMP